MNDFDLDEFLPYRVSLLANRISRKLEARYHSQFGIRVPEWRILAHLAQSGPASMRKLQERVELHKSRVSRAARRLERAGYVSISQNEHDGRLLDLELTGEGWRMMNEIVPIAEEFQKELHESLGSQKDAFRSGVETLLKASP